MNELKLVRGTSFWEFYYRGLSITNHKELAIYIKNNKWYFDKSSQEVQDQFRRLYQIYKKEAKDGKEN